jgi:hypothetical protein
LHFRLGRVRWVVEGRQGSAEGRRTEEEGESRVRLTSEEGGPEYIQIGISMEGEGQTRFQKLHYKLTVLLLGPDYHQLQALVPIGQGLGHVPCFLEEEGCVLKVPKVLEEGSVSQHFAHPRLHCSSSPFLLLR